jgi:TP901 family phage tail tape measure protein
MALTERLALVVALDADKAIKGLDTLGKKADDGLGRTNSGIAKTASRFQGLGVGMLGAGGAIAAGFGVAVNASMGFDKQLSELAAVAGATGEQMGLLREQALDAGAATVFSAGEAATAQTELAKAGVSTADIMGGALTGALDLASAGSLDLGRAAEIAAGAMTTFGLAGGDVTHIADVLAAGANKSATDVENLAQSLQQSGLVADGFGISLEETVGALSMFAQNGLKGSDAGTSFKTMLQRLVPQSDKAKTAMADLGIDMFDAGGNFIGLSGAAEELKTALGPLSEEARNTALNVIFGSDAVRAASIFYRGGAKDVEAWTKAVDEDGYAAELAGIKLDNLAGDLEALKGSFETALIQTGSGANDTLRFMVQGATDVVNAFAGLPGPVQTAGTAMAGLGSAALIGAGGLVILIPKVAQALDALEGMGANGSKAAGALGKLGKLGAASAGIAAVAGGLVLLHGALEKIFTDDLPDMGKLADSLVDLGQQSEISGQLARTFGEDLSGLGNDLQTMQSSYDAGFWERLGDAAWSTDLDEASGRINTLDETLAGLVKNGNAELAAAIFEELNAALSPDDQISLGVELNDYNSALDEAATTAKVAAGGIEGTNTAIDGTTTSATEAVDAISNYKDGLRALTDPIFAAEDAQLGLTEAQQGVLDAQAEFGKNSPEYLAAQGEQVRAAFDFQAALAELATGFADGTVSEAAYREALQKAVDDGLIPAGEAADIATYKFGVLTGKMDSVPGAVSTTVTTPGLETAINRVQVFKDLLSGGVSGWYPSTGLGAAFQTTIAESRQNTAGNAPIGGRAMGGPVDSGTTYVVGERGPELLTMGSSPGNVTPNHKLGGNTYHINVTSLDPRSASTLVVDAIKDFEASNGKGWRAA